MAAELGLDATGIDFSPKAIPGLAQKKALERSLLPRFLVADRCILNRAANGSTPSSIAGYFTYSMIATGGLAPNLPRPWRA